MSKAVKKVFKGVKKAVKSVANFVKKHWKKIVVAAAVVFTAGAALGYVGMGTGGGLVFGKAAVGAAAKAGVSQGIGAAWSALGNSALSAIGVKGSSGTGVFGQSNLAGVGKTGGSLAQAGGGAPVVTGKPTIVNGAGGGASAGAGAGGGAPVVTGQPSTIVSNAATQSTTNAVQGAANGTLGQTITAGTQKAGMSLADKLAIGSIATRGIGGYMQGKAEDEQLDFERERMNNMYAGDYNIQLNKPMSMDEVAPRPSSSLLQRPQATGQTGGNTSMSDYVVNETPYVA